MADRRDFMGGMLAGAAGLAGLGMREPALARQAPGADTLRARWARIEAGTGGRLGIAVLDTATGRRAGMRMDERFPLCSTFKLLAAAAVLERCDAGKESLERRIVVRPADLVEYSPATGKHLGAPGMTLAQLCEAAITLSDNTAGNLLLASLGGPAGLTAYARALGDEATRLDRNEPTLNEALPGDARDTTTPAAMLADLQTLLLKNRLTPPSRRQLLDWLRANKTGDARLRARLPAGWTVADKTGSGERGTANDIGVIYPPGRPPILAAVYLTGAGVSAPQRDAAIATIGASISTLV